MNQRATPQALQASRCRDLALAALGALLPPHPGDDAPPEARFLAEAAQRLAPAPDAAGGHPWQDAAGGPLWRDTAGIHAGLAAWQAAPPLRDARLHRAATALALSPVEALAVALAAAVEDDPVVGRVLAWLQAPHGPPRPTLGLLARALAPWQAAAAATDDPDREASALYALAGGRAVRAGLLQLDDDDARPLCDRTVRLPAPLAAALAGIDTDGPRTLAATPAGGDAEALAWVDALPTLREAADAWAARLAALPRATLVLRSASAEEARAFAAALAARLGRRPAWFDAEAEAARPADAEAPRPARTGPALPAGTEAWLALTQRLPVFVLHPAPGEVLALPALHGSDGPVLALVGLDGGVRRDGAAVADWRLPAPGPQERLALWRAGLGGSADEPAARDAATLAARRYRAGAGQITEHARLARLLAGPDAAALADAVARAATMTSAGRALDALALALPEPVPDAALVVGAAVQAELARALQRCEQREQLHAGLGAAARTRACDGVRLLFTGASGTGKSLAAKWLATRLGLPIYRVDLSAMLSKWIGDTEKHLAELLARAEHADVVLLFDEADSLFGKRTEIATANDRFANAQTNYLLQRIESHAGIVVLTSNSRQRFDPAFVRRLDFIVDFAAPDAQARRALWAAHLGPAHVGPAHVAPADAGEGAGLDAAALNRLAALADLAGGHIRNAVLAAAAAARARGAPIGFDDIAAAVRAEYRKLGRTPPAEL